MPNDGFDGEVEELDGLPVLADEPLQRSRALTMSAAPGLQAAAVAATGFVAGAAVVGLARRRRNHKALSRPRGGRRVGAASRRAGELVQIVGSRSLLVDVHLLGGRD
jgi:hypothetical protein